MEQFRTAFGPSRIDPPPPCLFSRSSFQNFGFSISSIFGSGEPVPSTSCNHHSLILVIQCLITQLLLAYNCLFPHWVVVARPIVIDDVVRRSRL